MSRALVARLVGVTVAAAVLLLAAQLLLYGFEADPLFVRTAVDDLASWIRGDPSDGAAFLAGVGLVLVAAWLAWILWTSRVGDGGTITTRRRHGWTKIDRASLADAFARRLEPLDRRSDLIVRVRRNGRVDLDVVTPDPTATGPINEYRDLIDEMALDRSLPVRSGRVRVTVPRRTTGRRRVR